MSSQEVVHLVMHLSVLYTQEGIRVTSHNTSKDQSNANSKHTYPYVEVKQGGIVFFSVHLPS